MNTEAVAIATRYWDIADVKSVKGVDALMSSVAAQLTGRLEILQQEGVKDIQVFWTNISSEKHNPDGTLGYFRIIGKKIMKLKYLNIVLALAAAVLCSCAAAPRMTPAPNIKAVRVANDKTRKSIENIDKAVTKAQADQKKIDAAAKAKDLVAIQAAVADLGRQLGIAKAEVMLARASAALAEAAAAKAQTDSAEQARQLGIAVKQNAAMKKIVDQVNSYWGLGAFAYGIKRLIIHLLITLVVVGGLGIGIWILSIAAPATAPFIMIGLRIVGSVFSVAGRGIAAFFGVLHRLLQMLFKRKSRLIGDDYDPIMAGSNGPLGYPQSPSIESSGPSTPQPPSDNL